MPTDTTLTTLAVATGGAFLGKFVGPAAEAIGKAAWEQAQQLGAKATAYLAAVGREPQPFEPKILLPLVLAASLETDPTLAEKWAALLANAADPVQRVAVQSGFIDVLRQLTPIDARVFEVIAGITPFNHIGSIPGFIQMDSISHQLGDIAATTLAVSIGNLIRLGLCLGATSQRALSSGGSFLSPPPRFNTVGPGLDFVQITPFGSAFLATVTPPTP